MTDETEAQRNARIAREAADRKNAAASTAEADAATAEGERAWAAAANPPDPAAVTVATAKAAKALRAANLARNEANAAEAAALKAEIAAAKEAVHNQEVQLKGIKIGSELSWDGFFEQDWIQLIKGLGQIKCVGPETKTQIGYSLTAIIGVKSEFCLTGKFTEICPYEGKNITGASWLKVLGWKKDTVHGAKWDEEHGAKYDTHIGHKVSIGPAETRKYPKRQSIISRLVERGFKWRFKVGDLADDADRVEEKASDMLNEVQKMSSVIGEFTRALNELQGEYGRLALKMKSGEIKMKAILIEGGGDITFDGSGATAKITGTAEIKKGGSSVLCDAGMLSVDGSEIRLK